MHLRKLLEQLRWERAAIDAAIDTLEGIGSGPPMLVRKMFSTQPAAPCEKSRET
jgi:hypothetical protein